MVVGCNSCSQTTLAPWWAGVPNNRSVTRSGLAEGAVRVAGSQWYIYRGLRSGSVTFKVSGGTNYRAGRTGHARFLRVAASDIRYFESGYGHEFSILGDGDEVQLSNLIEPSMDHVDLLPDGVGPEITVRVLRGCGLVLLGDVIGSTPQYVGSELGIGDQDARDWMLGLRVRAGWTSNEVVVLPRGVDAAEDVIGETGAAFDFGMIHGIGAALEGKLKDAGIISANDFLNAEVAKLGEITGRSESLIFGWRNEVFEIVERQSNNGS